MVKITEELIRKKAEHNEGIIGTLEELSLHQEDVEQIENINNWCKNIQILYLQSNLIAKIENLNKLKNLRYLNLAINNIEIIENLERCESLEKLDLTLNFIGDLRSICNLKANANLKHLYLTGNPCQEFTSYRQYVIFHLPQLETLDGTGIVRSEGIVARQNITRIEKQIQKHIQEYHEFRQMQKLRVEKNSHAHLNDEDYWKSSSEHCPETRIEMCQRTRKNKGLDKENTKPKKSIKMFTNDGKPRNINQAKLNFKLIDDDPEKIILDLAVYKYLDTSLIHIDLQPNYVTVTVKGKIFQIVLSEEISLTHSTAKRSQTTGHLVLEMPRANYKPIKVNKSSIITKENKANDDRATTNIMKAVDSSSEEFHHERETTYEDDLEIPPLEHGMKTT